MGAENPVTHLINAYATSPSRIHSPTSGNSRAATLTGRDAEAFERRVRAADRKAATEEI